MPVGTILQQSLPDPWFRRKSFDAWRLVLFQWILLSCFISYGYKSTLLSTLIPIRSVKSPSYILSISKWIYS